MLTVSKMRPTSHARGGTSLVQGITQINYHRYIAKMIDSSLSRTEHLGVPTAVYILSYHICNGHDN